MIFGLKMFQNVASTVVRMRNVADSASMPPKITQVNMASLRELYGFSAQILAIPSPRKSDHLYLSQDFFARPQRCMQPVLPAPWRWSSACSKLAARLQGVMDNCGPWPHCMMLGPRRSPYCRLAPVIVTGEAVGAKVSMFPLGNMEKNRCIS